MKGFFASRMVCFRESVPSLLALGAECVAVLGWGARSWVSLCETCSGSGWSR